MAERKYGDLGNQVVVVTGGSGFLAGNLAQELLARGARLRVVSRRPERAFRLRPLAALGQIQFVRADVTGGAPLEALYAGAAAGVNLIGSFGGDLEAIHAESAGRLAAAAKAAGAQAFVQVSAIGADPESPVDYARTKGQGEQAVRAAFPTATIIRPSVLFGEDDRFINMFAGLIARLPAVPVFGPNSRLQPLDVADAARAIANALADPGLHGGKLYEIAGPEPMTMLEINQAIAAGQGRQRLLIPVPDWVAGAFAAATGWLPGAPLSSDQWALLKAGNVPSGNFPGIEELGVAPRPLSLYLERWMVRYRRHGRFSERTRAGREQLPPSDATVRR